MTVTPNTVPIYPKEIFKWRARVTQGLNREGASGTAVILGTGGINGSIIHTIDIKPTGVFVANTGRIFTKRVNDQAMLLSEEVAIPAVPAGTVDTEPLPRTTFDLPLASPNYVGAGVMYKALFLEPGEIVYASIATSVSSNGIIFTARGGHY